MDPSAVPHFVLGLWEVIKPLLEFIILYNHYKENKYLQESVNELKKLLHIGNKKSYILDEDQNYTIESVRKKNKSIERLFA